MHGVVSLLDQKCSEQVVNLWGEMERRFAVNGVLITPIPHFSYHIAEEYADGVMAILQEAARETAVFTVKTGGIGIFTGTSPVIYLPVARTPALCRLHEHIWPKLDALATKGAAYYAPDNWFPHITIGWGDITPVLLGPIVNWLNGKDLEWELTVDNLAYVHDPGDKPHELREKVLFGNQ